jgi:hypothetical protein
MELNILQGLYLIILKARLPKYYMNKHAKPRLQKHPLIADGPVYPVSADHGVRKRRMP